MWFKRRLNEIIYNRELKKQQHKKTLCIEKAKWKNFCDSPVVLMVDDFTNAWFDANSNGQVDLGEDWGAMCGEPNSAIWFLYENLLSRFPYMAITFFAVLGEISSFSKEYSFTSSAPINSNREMVGFCQDLVKNKNIEVAYHGYNHGFLDEQGNFVQEWKWFRDFDMAYRQTQLGMEIYGEVFGHLPLGGKYGGYTYQNFSDDVVDECFFLWWCRDWLPRCHHKHTAQDNCYELMYFGENNVIDIPSTVHGKKWTRKQIEILLENQQVITIQEHIAKFRPDSVGIQRPNLMDDIEDLILLYDYLEGRNVWHATLSEIAQYFEAYTLTTFSVIGSSKFKVDYKGRSVLPVLTVRLNCRGICTSEKPFIRIVHQKGCEINIDPVVIDKNGYQHIINLPISSGIYTVVPTERNKTIV